ncbi:uncharacterized protein Triagg1_10322 [Trichoderma aggressivum f. europaeum]|uniref:Uncharacterized protein n=1 Tax=Trichoderma aggressivum f. europaeum TaxID=173218 RepID=A0AAE1I7G4_9HYPO|nr:hypothetical protein Triagg1_10322 [Trichoderma aggressivum f. europaeum]
MNLVEHHNFLVQVLASARRPFTWENATRTPSVCSASDTNYKCLTINNPPKTFACLAPMGGVSATALIASSNVDPMFFAEENQTMRKRSSGGKEEASPPSPTAYAHRAKQEMRQPSWTPSTDLHATTETEIDKSGHARFATYEYEYQAAMFLLTDKHFARNMDTKE